MAALLFLKEFYTNGDNDDILPFLDSVYFKALGAEKSLIPYTPECDSSA